MISVMFLIALPILPSGSRNSLASNEPVEAPERVARPTAAPAAPAPRVIPVVAPRPAPEYEDEHEDDDEVVRIDAFLQDCDPTIPPA